MSYLLDRTAIERLIPHRHPILMLDGITEINAENNSIRAEKKLVEGGSYFEGHFPGHPIMPGVLMVEAMAQAAAVLITHVMGRTAENSLFYFMALEKVRFRQPARPGDVLDMQVHQVKRLRDIYVFAGTVTIDGNRAVEAEFTAKILER